jgi:hypothetical protein
MEVAADRRREVEQLRQQLGETEAALQQRRGASASMLSLSVCNVTSMCTMKHTQPATHDLLLLNAWRLHTVAGPRLGRRKQHCSSAEVRSVDAFCKQRDEQMYLVELLQPDMTSVFLLNTWLLHTVAGPRNITLAHTTLNI